MSNTIRAIRAVALVAFVVVSSVVWVVYRTVGRAQDSNQAIVHTQEVLTANVHDSCHVAACTHAPSGRGC